MLLAGVVVVNVATLVALWLLFQLAREETRDEETAGRTVFYAAFFPLAFYYAVPYAEAVFLATSIGTFLAARRRHWVRAGAWAAFAAAARPFGILLLLVLMLEVIIAAWRGELRGRAWLRALLGLALAPLGLLYFMFLLRQTTGDALAFIAVQRSAWGRQPRFPLATLRLGLNYALHPTLSHGAATYARTLLHTVIVVGFLAILVISVRRWRPSFVLYGVLLFAVMLSSPWPGETVMHSLGRSAMIFFPVYITLAQWGRRPGVHQAILGLWLPLFGLLAALYVCWYFVA
jgi:Gpi18-like mannosyltransferase